ncbi:tRNA-specific 2-thiouridylase MnmA [bioreactor metagenome]|uniref:tRNA-specific 2-thiouridylase MnmA n=1 Tax=bioreactor metagenome TaxID=1076179 RepID=A0A645G1P2_9ZZZZ
MGEHRGLVRYTVGQRRGLGLSLGRPQYVVGKDPHTNTVTVGEERDLYQSRVRVNDLNLIAAERLESPVRAAVKTRYSQKEADATLYPLENGLLEAVFDQPQRAPAAGQAAVFYQGDLVLGGGTICRADRA